MCHKKDSGNVLRKSLTLTDIFLLLSKYLTKIWRKTNDHLTKLGAKFCESKGEKAAVLIQFKSLLTSS